MRKATFDTLFYVALLTGLPGVSAAAQSPRSVAQVRSIILRSKHLGAHGMGFGDRSLNELAHQLTPEDLPALIDLLAEQHLRTGVSFALASQCAAAIEPVRDAATLHKMQFYEAQEVMDLIAGFAGCSADAKEKAAAMRQELSALSEAVREKSSTRAKQDAENDARIQRNGIKMMDPKQAATLTREEREEVYHRSLKAMGLDENGPLTPQQRDMVNRMYRTMVLGEPGPPKPQPN
jgi:hypothetical protein